MRRQRFLHHLLAGLTLLVAGLILTDWLPALRGPAPDTREWHWPYELRPLGRWWLPLLAAAVMWLIDIWWLRQRRSATALGLAGLVLGSLLLQLGLVYAHRPEVAAELIDRTLANETNGYFAVAAETSDMTDLLHTFPQVMPTLPSEHARTHPPGLILAQWLTIRAGAAVSPLAPAIYPLRCTDLWLLNQPAAAVAALGVWAFLPLVAAAFTVVPVYYLGFRLYDANVARLSAMFVAALPSLLLFAPTPDQLFALLSTLTFLVWLVAVQRRSAPHAFLAGLLLSGSIFLSLGNGALVVALAVFVLLHANHQSRIVNLEWLIWFLAGLASVWVVYWVGWGVAPWDVTGVALQQHYTLVTSQRRYDWWLVYNLVDVFLFAGPVVVMGFVAAFLTAIRHLSSSTAEAAGRLAIALGLLLIILNLTGSARGEVGRLWLFFIPLLAVIATGYLFSSGARSNVRTFERLNVRTIILLLAAQLVLVLSLGLAWKPMEAVIVVAQRPEMPFLTTPKHELSTSFGETIRLIGYDLGTEQASPGGVLDLTLYWQASDAATRPYTVFTHLVNQDGELVAQKDNWPVNGRWPPTCWKANEMVVDPYTIQLPAGLRTGTYSLLVGLYDADTGARLTTPDGQDALSLVDDLTIGR
jgi:hypothetical protein